MRNIQLGDPCPYCKSARVKAHIDAELRIEARCPHCGSRFCNVFDSQGRSHYTSVEEDNEDQALAEEVPFGNLTAKPGPVSPPQEKAWIRDLLRMMYHPGHQLTRKVE